jgi:hypothetical protein
MANQLNRSQIRGIPSGSGGVHARAIPLLLRLSLLAIACAACEGSKTVRVRDVLLHPEAFQDSSIAVAGHLSTDAITIPYTGWILRRLVDGIDTITVLTASDTLVDHVVTTLRGRVASAAVFGVLRVGPVLVIGTPDAFIQRALQR